VDWSRFVGMSSIFALNLLFWWGLVSLLRWLYLIVTA
jgi:hypothetical protein